MHLEKRDVVIFGVGKTADVVSYFFEHESDFNVVGFTVTSDYLEADSFKGLPVVPFEEITERYPPSRFLIFIAMGYAGLNHYRAQIYTQAKSLGYSFASYTHPRSGIPKDMPVGDNCFIMNDVHIHPFVTLGDNNFVWSGVIICHHTVIGSHCWFTSGTNIAGNNVIGSFCFFAINSTLTDGLEIGDRCLLGANTLVSSNLEAGSVVIAAPEKKYPLTSKEFLALKGDSF